MKEISSDGNINTVDLIFQTWPIFISLNPEWIRLLFQPVLSYLNSGAWPHPWVIHDIGACKRPRARFLEYADAFAAYPNATGHDDGQAEEMPIFETSSLFILLYAYQKLSGDASFASQYQPLLDGYAKWLAGNDTLYPNNQLISVDAITPQPNQTALAIQSAIGLNAASILTGDKQYSTLASSYAHTIYDKGLGLNGPTPSQSTHFTYYYGHDRTWNVLFASYSDVVLDLKTFPSSAWALQSSWYATQIKQEGLPFAGPKDYIAYTGSNLNWGLEDWSKLCSYPLRCLQA